MALFGTVRKTYVSSAVYNMAGEIETRPDFLKTVILGNMLTNPNFSISKSLQENYIRGPGIKLRSYYKWADQNYRLVGIPGDGFYSPPRFASGVFEDELEGLFGYPVAINWIDSGRRDVVFWAREWVWDHYREHDEGGWTADFIEETGEILIVFKDGFNPVRFTPEAYHQGTYLYVSYSIQEENDVWSKPKLLIYRLGTGLPVLDAQYFIQVMRGRYLPYIPVRHENKFLSESYMPDVYKVAKKAYKKALGADYDDLVENLKDNASLGDIDFAYVAFGVSLNTKLNAGKKYLYNFFQRVKDGQRFTESDYVTWTTDVSTYTADMRQWETWKINQQEVPPGDPPTQPEPPRPVAPSQPLNTVRINQAGPAKLNFDMEVTWSAIVEQFGTGLSKPDAKVGEVWISRNSAVNTVTIPGYEMSDTTTVNTGQIFIVWQTSATTWKQLVITGLVYRNHIYNGKFEEILGHEALDVGDEYEESGFLVPIEIELFRAMSLVDSTQLASQCAQMVVNSYQIVKKKWYQRGAFKVLLVIVVIIVILVTGGFGAGSAGLLGTNAGVGTALGFSGTAAIVAGVVANMIAAMILTKLITAASVAILGEKLGTLVAIVASFIALQVGSAMQAGQSLSQSFSQMMDANNILQLTQAVGDGYAGYIRADAANVASQTQEMLTDYEKQSKEISDRYAEIIGYDTGIFDPLQFTGTFGFQYESRDSFLTRTLMTGSDIADLSLDLVTNFADITLNTELA